MVQEIQETLLWLPGILLALTVHEYSHAAVAYYFGDDTAKMQGRMTLNPIVHLDPLGFIMMIVAHFGWAKPVPVNPYNLANPKKNMVWVSLAGPASNMALALIISVIIKVILIAELSVGIQLHYILRYAFYINLILAIFNMIPLAPLDGQKIVSGLLPIEQSIKFEEFSKKGPFLLLGLIIFGRLTGVSILGYIFVPWINFWSNILL